MSVLQNAVYDISIDTAQYEQCAASGTDSAHTSIWAFDSVNIVCLFVFSINVTCLWFSGKIINLVWE